MRSRTAAIASGRYSLLPGLGINTLRAGSGRQLWLLQFVGQFVQQPGHPVLLDLGQGGLVDD